MSEDRQQSIGQVYQAYQANAVHNILSHNGGYLSNSGIGGGPLTPQQRAHNSYSNPSGNGDYGSAPRNGSCWVAPSLKQSSPYDTPAPSPFAKQPRIAPQPEPPMRAQPLARAHGHAPRAPVQHAQPESLEEIYARIKREVRAEMEADARARSQAIERTRARPLTHAQLQAQLRAQARAQAEVEAQADAHALIQARAQAQMWNARAQAEAQADAYAWAQVRAQAQVWQAQALNNHVQAHAHAQFQIWPIRVEQNTPPVIFQTGRPPQNLPVHYNNNAVYYL